MKRILKSLVLVVGMLMLPTVAYAQNIYADVNGDLEVNIADINTVISVILSDVSNPGADVNGDGEINIADINAVIDFILGGSFDGENEGGFVEPTELELSLTSLTCDEESSPITTYSDSDSLEYDELAKEVIMLFAPTDSDETDEPSMNVMLKSESEDDLAQDAIRNNNINIFENSLSIEQLDWNSGLWGKTHYGGFETYFNTHVKNGKRCLLVVFYHKGGFPNSKTAYLKIGQVNSGRIAGKIRINAGTEYAFFNVQIDDYLSSHGIVNFFPLVITNDSKARNYLNPIIVKTKPLIDENWNNKYFGYEFGTINNTSVYYNKGKNLSIDDDATYQCVELCKRYITDQYAFINHPYGSKWGYAKQWPTKRIEDEEEYGDKYRVIVNDGHERVREGDIIVWNRGTYGHVGVVIKTARQKNGSEYISVAHQNGGTGDHADPIGMTLQVVDKVITNIRNGCDYAPIFTKDTKISHFIRVYNDNEETSSYGSSMTASTTYLRFGKRDVGTSYTRKFTITNHGYSPLTISSMSPVNGEAFSIDVSSCILNPSETREFHVTFSPTKAGDYEDRIIIRSNADDNPRWLIKLFGIGREPENPNGRQLMLSKNVHGTEYRLYKQIIDENDTRINPDGSIYYRTQLTLDVIKSSNTETYVVDSDVYHDPQHGGQQPAMLFDLISNQLHIFYNSKVEGNHYKLNGYNYVTSLSNINFNKETVFNGYNWGWFPYYEYNNGQIIIHHFSYAGYYAMKSVRNGNGSWSNTRMNSISPQAFAQMWEQTEHALVVEP